MGKAAYISVRVSGMRNFVKKGERSGANSKCARRFLFVRQLLVFARKSEAGIRVCIEELRQGVCMCSSAH